MQNFKATTVAQGIRCAEDLLTTAKLLGTPLTRCQALAHIAKANGYANWSSFKDDEVRRVDALLLPTERLHAAQAGVMSYGEESAIYVKSGFTVRFQCDMDGNLEYARVTDPLGREIVYWDSSEVTEDPAGVTGALLRYASRNTSGTQAPMTEKSGELPLPMPQIGMNLAALNAVLYNDCYFPVHHSLQPQDWSNVSPDTEALNLLVLDEGEEHELSISVGELLSMKWDPALQAYITAQGRNRLKFYRNQQVKVFNNG